MKKFLINYLIFCVMLTAVLDGNTQSYMSTPNAQQTTISIAKPTPIKYLGLFLGRMLVVK